MGHDAAEQVIDAADAEPVGLLRGERVRRDEIQRPARGAAGSWKPPQAQPMSLAILSANCSSALRSCALPCEAGWGA